MYRSAFSSNIWSKGIINHYCERMHCTISPFGLYVQPPDPIYGNRPIYTPGIDHRIHSLLIFLARDYV